MRRWWRWARRNRNRRYAARPTVLGFVRAGGMFALVSLVLASQAVAFYQEPGLNGIASTLAGKKVQVNCAEPVDEATEEGFAIWGAEGYVKGWVDPTGRWRPYAKTYFRGIHCEILLAAMAGDLSGYTVEQVGWAVLVLTHESGHLRGAPWAGDEAKTECWALHHFHSTLNMLGFRSADQHALMDWQVVEIHKTQIPEEYHLPGCEPPKPHWHP